MDGYEYVIRFHASAADSNHYAQELEEAFANSGMQVKRQREATDTQDFGSMLLVFLGSQTAVALLNVLSTWLQRRRSVAITIEDSKRKISIQNVTSKEAAKLADFLLHKK